MKFAISRQRNNYRFWAGRGQGADAARCHAFPAMWKTPDLSTEFPRLRYGLWYGFENRMWKSASESIFLLSSGRGVRSTARFSGENRPVRSTPTVVKQSPRRSLHWRFKPDHPPHRGSWGPRGALPRVPLRLLAPSAPINMGAPTPAAFEHITCSTRVARANPLTVPVLDFVKRGGRGRLSSRCSSSRYA